MAVSRDDGTAISVRVVLVDTDEPAVSSLLVAELDQLIEPAETQTVAVEHEQSGL